MESGTIGDSGNDLESRLRVRWNENCKVYARRVNKKALKISASNDCATANANPATLTSTTENPPSGFPTSPGGAAAEVPFSTVAAVTATTKSPTISVGGKPTEPAANTSRAVIVGSPTVTATEHLKNTENVGTEQYLHQEKASPENLASKGGSNQNGVQEGSGVQAAEPLRLKINNLKDSSTQVNGNDLPRKSGHGRPVIPQVSSPQPSANDLPNGRETTGPQLASGYELQNGGEATSVPSPLPSGNEPDTVNGNVRPLVITRVDDRVRFNLSKALPRNEILDLKKRLESELERVRTLFKQLEAKNDNLAGSLGSNMGGYIQPEPEPEPHHQPQYVRSDSVENRMLVRVNSEMGPTVHLATRPMGLARVNSDVGATRFMEPRPYGRQLSVAVMENNHMAGEYTEKEKRTPKANQYYRNSEFLLGKDRLPPENNKRLKTNNKRKFGGHGYGFGFPMDKDLIQVFRSCSNLLQRLMKHKHGWVFNTPVDARSLGLHDYHDIIKYPMDLGTIKNRLSQNWYKSPRDFAEDVRLVFRNAMTYNPKGQDVHLMAQQLSEIFEERWVVIETEYNPYWKYQMYHDAGLPTPTTRKAPPQPHFAAPAAASFPTHSLSASQTTTLDRSESVAAPASLDPKIQRTHVGRMPVPKKPKAKDPNKRDMTYEEKQRLSKNLQSLPSEKLDAIVQIIKKRNTTLCQNDNEIEVDIDAVDAETLWELDRFVTNFKKSLSKYKRKAELARQARTGANLGVPVTTTAPALSEVPIESGPGGKNPAPPLSVQDGKQGYNGSRSSSSSSSSSDSGSSSSDSDSDSSSADGSDEGN